MKIEYYKRLVEATPPGMAYWLGTGPVGTVCEQCSFYGYDIQYPNSCHRYFLLTTQHGARFRSQLRHVIFSRDGRGRNLKSGLVGCYGCLVALERKLRRQDDERATSTLRWQETKKLSGCPQSHNPSPDFPLGANGFRRFWIPPQWSDRAGVNARVVGGPITALTTRIVTMWNGGKRRSRSAAA